MASQLKPAFGWLVLGLSVGAVIGHAAAFLFVVPPGYFFLYAERATYIIVGCGVAGMVMAAALERQLRRLRMDCAMIIVVIVSLLYFVLVGLPVMNAARE